MIIFDKLEKKVIRHFEYVLCKYIGCKYAIFMSSGSAALHSALSVLNLRKGDEVIVPINCFSSVLSAIILVGANPVFVDIKKTTFNINEDLIEDKINAKTKAILIVDSFGNPNNCSNIKKIASKHHLTVVEDAAQAFGSKYNGKRVGNYFDLTCFSFNKKKILSAMTGGGLVTTNNKNYSRRIREFINYGIGKSNSSFGWNYLPNFVSALILLSKISYLNIFMNMRLREKNELFRKIIRFNVIFQQEEPGCTSNWSQLVFFCKNFNKSTYKNLRRNISFEKVKSYNDWYYIKNKEDLSKHRVFVALKERLMKISK
jgi:dTDP-4-amino-4,6-dideoxygalactose transaminase